jgi:uncharacterized membrane protein
VRPVDRGAVRFLAAAERSGISLRRVPAYVRGWILLESTPRRPKPERTNWRNGTMERMLVVVFDDEKTAYEGRSALRQLAAEGSITLFGNAVVAKDADGKLHYKDSEDNGPVGTLSGAAVGGLVGLLGGPVGAVVGGGAGLTLGALYDVSRIGETFAEEVTSVLMPSHVAVIAEIDEDWTMPVDTRMEALGGIVLRRALSEVRESRHEQEVAAMKADLAQLKLEMAEARAERKAKLKAKVDELNARIEALQKKQRERRLVFESRQKAKRELLKQNVAKAGRALRELAHTPV